MFKPFCYKMINNNIRAEPKLATSAATFLKWEEVYIFCFCSQRLWSWEIPASERFLPPALLYVFVLWRWAPRQGLSFPLQSEQWSGIYLQLLQSAFSSCLPPSPSISPSRFPHSVSSFCAVCLSLPCSRSLPNSKALLKCCASLPLARLSFQTLAGSFAALLCSVPHLWIPAVWMC